MRIPFNAACDFLGISISTAERLVRDGKLTCMRNAFTNRREFEVTYLRKLREG
jgi:predicted site-specific integrase-resolvase